MSSVNTFLFRYIRKKHVEVISYIYPVKKHNCLKCSWSTYENQVDDQVDDLTHFMIKFKNMVSFLYGRVERVEVLSKAANPNLTYFFFLLKSARLMEAPETSKILIKKWVVNGGSYFGRITDRCESRYFETSKHFRQNS